MNKNACPRCTTTLIDLPLFKCVRCFTVYCKECEGTNGGRLCPECQMSLRMVVSLEEQK